MYQNEFLNKSLADIFKNKIEVSFFGLRCMLVMSINNLECVTEVNYLKFGSKIK